MIYWRVTEEEEGDSMLLLRIRDVSGIHHLLYNNNTNVLVIHDIRLLSLSLN